jgi:FkbM family methyltransferase
MSAPPALISSPVELRKRRSLLSVARGLWHWLEIHLARQQFTRVQVPLLGLEFTVPADTIFSWNLRKYQCYEADNTNLLRKRFAAGAGGRFLDVGANFGWFTLLLSQFAGTQGKVVAIEPAPDNHALLQGNIAANAARNIAVHNTGVAEKAQTLVLRHGPKGNPGKHSFAAVSDTHTAANNPQITLTTLDAIADEEFGTDGWIDLIKMDIEGYEVAAFLGGKHTLARCKTILVEYTPSFLWAAGHTPTQFFQLLEQAGFALHRIEGDQLRLLSKPDIESLLAQSQPEHWLQCDLFGINMQATSGHASA